MVVAACDTGGTYRPAPAPYPPPSQPAPPPGGQTTNPPPGNTAAQCTFDSDCVGALGNLGACSFAVCSSGGVCVASNAVDGTPCSDSECAFGACFMGTCVPDADSCSLPPDPPPSSNPPPSPAPYCGDGYCDGGEDCTLCPSDCGTCAGSCCEDNNSIGCVDPDIVDCVCAFDSYCCETEWDATCAEQVDSLGCGSCAAVPFCGDGICDAGDTCSNCAQDCGACPAPEPYCGDGICDAGDTCANCAQDCGACPPPAPYCGDGICDAGDTCANCFADCGACPPPAPFCGDGLCNGGESCGSCASDCGVCPSPDPVCGDGFCDFGEDCSLCPEDCGSCAGDCCSDNGSIGCVDPDVVDCVCAADPYCCENTWDAECASKVEELGCGACTEPAYCGDGYCDFGDDCGNCPQDCGTCPEPEPYCGDGICDAGDTCGNCAQDCGACPPPEPFCGDGYCDFGDDCGNCPADCGACPAPEPFCGDGVCDAGDTCGNCPQDCGACPPPEPFCGDGYCDFGDDCSTCPEDCGFCEGSCCEDHGGIGCEDPDVTDAVCAIDAFCCESGWDADCVSLADSEGLTACFADQVCGDGWCEGSEDGSWCPEDCGELSQDCCMDVGAVSCSDSFIAQCVCDADDYCCTTAWDDTCAALVDELGCGFCSVPPAP